jgi:hypothetical protein
VWKLLTAKELSNNLCPRERKEKAESVEVVEKAGRFGEGYPTPGCFGQRVRNRLKRKEL